MINSRSLDFLNSISDADVKKSLESDSPEFAVPAILENQLNALTIKLEAMNSVINDSLKKHEIQLVRIPQVEIHSCVVQSGLR